jgi:hypothetical protein
MGEELVEDVVFAEDVVDGGWRGGDGLAGIESL